MKKIALSVAALALTAGSALAADLPSRKEPLLPPPPPPPLWTGFYVGVNAGGGWANSNTTQLGSGPFFIDQTAPAVAAALAAGYSGTANFGIPGRSNGGFIGGGQIGYNWQFYNSFVAGIEADIQGVAGSSGGNNLLTAAAVPAPLGGSYITSYSGSAHIDYFGTVRGRLGWLFTPTLLAYATGGLAYGGVTSNISSVGTYVGPAGGIPFAPVTGATSFGDTRVGWTIGGGLEWLFLPSWSAKVEYLYYDLGSIQTTYAVAQANPVLPSGTSFNSGVTATTHLSGNVVRAGLNYHFNWGPPAPVVAKY